MLHYRPSTEVVDIRHDVEGKAAIQALEVNGLCIGSVGLDANSIFKRNESNNLVVGELH